jgi:integrase
MIKLLRKLMERNGEGYVFSPDGGGKPVCRKHIYDEFHRALKRIGIGPEEIARRGLSIHSWRHFLNTELQLQGLSLQQVQAVIGHKSEQMTGLYSHFDARQLSMVMEAQRIISGEKKGGRAAKAGRVLPFPAGETTGKRKRA